MPRIADHLLQCSFYVYESVESAKAGKRFGGSGFLVNVPSTHEGWLHLYAVTNRHVLDKGFHVLRLNTRDGKSEPFPTSPDSWIHHPDGDDLAVRPIEFDSTRVQWHSIGTDKFITREIEKDYFVGPGDDTFMIGRLVTLEGLQRNTPIVRFGYISMSPGEPISVDGRDHEAFLIECRSLSGFSGSPVFVTTKRYFDDLTMPTDLRPIPNPDPSSGRPTSITLSGTFGPWLLGVDFAHMPLWKPVFPWDLVTEKVLVEDETNYRVGANTGIACVVPAWRLFALLQDEDLVKQRRKEDEEIARKKRQSTVVLEVEASPPEFTRKDFKDVLKKVSRRLPDKRKK